MHKPKYPKKKFKKSQTHQSRLRLEKELRGRERAPQQRGLGSRGLVVYGLGSRSLVVHGLGSRGQVVLGLGLRAAWAAQAGSRGLGLAGWSSTWVAHNGLKPI